MTNTCGTCKHWQCTNKLRDGTAWADCYHVIATLQPKLLLCYNQVDETTRTYFKVPFDPHDVKYWWYNERFIQLYQYFKALNHHIKYCTIIEEDFKYDQHGAERVAVVKLHYFQTSKSYECEQWKEI
jgi:hypothetical protein